MIKKIALFIGNVITLILLGATIVLVISLVKSRLELNEVPSVMGYRLMNVLSGSMRPKLQPGDMILIGPVDIKKIQHGDIVTYRTNEGMFVTHRITSINKRNEELIIKTKGDANNVEDEGVVPSNRLVGLMLFRIPYGGYAARFIRSPLGLAVITFLFLSAILGNGIKKVLLRPKGELVKVKGSK